MQQFIQELASLPKWFSVGCAAIMGLAIGSFLTVVVHRLPVVLERAWARDEGRSVDGGTYNLCVPRSSCPSCGHFLRPWENIPVFSFILLRGRCSACGAAIPWRYIAIEVSSACLAVATVYTFGVTGKACAAYLFGASLLALACIDMKTGLLPDVMTLPLLACGLLVNALGGFVTLPDALAGVVGGCAALGVVLVVSLLITRREGMGIGDIKLFGAIGAWLGFWAIPQVFLLSFGLAAAHGVFMLARRDARLQDAMPFGPFIAIASAFTLFAGVVIR
ncbi:prepilin peptidase [Burkholderia ubonensis]|uniref:Prepilin leader peptidase/N-methyltransferase n=1 Tax=Burkholderia ubonensis subsp. mesacidophila TaxID=265293 RepID=A0A2A4FBK3_9BURK|nr:A24 family peptidase [Burkholderia ubonensis]PCE30050.1 hypothetical protein BZL54_23075 [Burkholderia ubonensis subsp. mesacidophila]